MIGALDNIRSAQNVGSIFRTADGAGVSELLLGGLTPTPDQQPSISKTSLGAEKTTPWRGFPNLARALKQFKSEGWLLLALETTPQACCLHQFQLEPALGDRLILAVGSEPAGIDPAIVRLADQVLFIPMAGEKTSLNVSVAFGIAAYYLLWG